MRILYFDCFSGAAGDMILGALVDAGAPAQDVTAALRSLDLRGWSLDLSETTRGSLRATRAEVTIEDDAGPRPLSEILDAVRNSGLLDGIKQRALNAFEILGRAEAKTHGVAFEDVHLHEAGSLDAIVDVVGSCTALEHFMPARVITSPITTGRGMTDGDHGPIPIPAPAVVEILRGATLVERGTEELITPTGAAILAAITDEFGAMPPTRVEDIGYGAGARDPEAPNVLRVMVGNEATSVEPAEDKSLLLEANIDDMSPELLPHVIESLLAAGAQDAWVTPIVMKKGRPAFTLSVISDPMHRYHLLEMIFRETTTFGVRSQLVRRDVLHRRTVEVEVEGHLARVKLGMRSGDITTASVEHDDALEIARKTGLPLKEVYSLALEAASEQMEEPTG